MNHIPILILSLLITTQSFAQNTTPAYPTGETHKYTFANSKIFPGAARDYWIYIPRQYNPTKPACLIVDQDNIQFKSPAVFDRLIASGQMPITIAVYVAPGKVKAPTTRALDRFNRSYEFDTLSDDYVRFLLDELLPDAENKTADDGRPIHFSRSPNDRAIMGSSSGAICAFTAAWNRPDSFNRVFSAIGTFVDLRGGNIYPSLIRKFEPKPIRIFLQDGSADHNHYGGDWWMANQEMERALTFAGYEVNHVWGTGDHDQKQADAIFADAMIWLWKDWPAPVKTGLGSEQLQQILIPGESWQPVNGSFRSPAALTTNAAGDVLFTDTTGDFVITPDSSVTQLPPTTPAKLAQAFGPDGSLYFAAPNQLFIETAAGRNPIATNNPQPRNMVITSTGFAYFTQQSPTPALWCMTAINKINIVDTGLKSYGGIALSPDQSLLYASDAQSHWVYSYQIQPDGSLAYKQKYYDLYVPDSEDDAGAHAMHADRDGRLYVSTNSGIQVCDQAGRVVAIIPAPGGPVTDLAFGGDKLDKLYAVSGGKIYARQLKVSGALPFQPPIKPAPPKL